MSQQGIRSWEAIILAILKTRIELLAGDNQDIRLAQVLDEGKESMEDRFCEITFGKEPKR